MYREKKSPFPIHFIFKKNNKIETEKRLEKKKQPESAINLERTIRIHLT